MDIDYDDLLAFLNISELKTISRAAQRLHISQPALSLKLKKIESKLQKTLFRRSQTGVKLTVDGQAFLQYARARMTLERELFHQLVEPNESKLVGLEGAVRISGHYSALYHHIVPRLQWLFQENPRLVLHLIVKEDKYVLETLTSHYVDFAVLQNPVDRSGIAYQLIGREKYVAVESSKYASRNETYIDSDPSDSLTDQFLSSQGKGLKNNEARCYMHDENGIARGVALGFGRAVLAEEEIASHQGIRVIKGLKPFYLSMYLHYPKQPHYTATQKAVLDVLTQKP